MYHCTRICFVLAKNGNCICSELLNVQEVLETPVEATAYVRKITKPGTVTNAASKAPKPAGLSKPARKDTSKAVGTRKRPLWSNEGRSKAKINEGGSEGCVETDLHKSRGV